MKAYGAMRTHGGGTLTANDVGETVELAGWVATRRDHGGVAFLDLRDASGIVQVVADPEQSEALEAAHRVRTEWVVRVVGDVAARPEGMVNENLPTGEVEVRASTLDVLSVAQTSPFPIEDGIEVDEALRLKHRYLDLRRPELQRVLRLRARMNAIMRGVMERNGFVEVETPMLTRATPEGARDFLVPSRLQPGETYALPQSPQLFKQLLQVAGLERYYQIVRCFRDEDLRADRQPEFTQLDVEMSFGDEDDVFALAEELLADVWGELGEAEVTVPLPRMTHAEAMDRYGSDKPDTRFGLELHRLDELFADTDVGVFRGVLDSGGSVVAVNVPGAAGAMTRKVFDGWVDWAKGRGAKGLAWGKFNPDAASDGATFQSPLAKFMSPDEIEGLRATVGAEAGDAVFFGAGELRWTQELMGAFRVAVAHSLDLVPSDEVAALWIVDFPLFEATDTGWAARHHPFTSPAAASADTFEAEPGSATARAYDLVINGNEAAGGSIRIHDRHVQQRLFAFLGIDAEEAEEKFGFLLRGLSYGAPPHGGIAFGLDRWVMLLTGRDNIRDAIAFPKTQSGSCLLTDAPSAYEPGVLRDLGLRALPKVTKQTDGEARPNEDLATDG